MIKVNDNSIYHHKRVDNTSDSSLSILKLDGLNIGYVIGDEPRVEKVAGETRIPANMYELKIRKELTPLTKRYKSKFNWFEYHIEITGIFNFKDVYVHIGNDEGDTAGCPVIGRDASLTDKGEFRNKLSTDLYKEWYIATYKALKYGKRVFWNITDNE